MVSNRERGRTAMAALDRRNPTLDDFVGLNWSSWVDKANVLLEGTNVEEYSNGIQCTETMTLRKEDMHIYGHCPAHDDFYLVVCIHCDQVVKPQAFEQHCERRHGALAKTCSQSSKLAPQPRPHPGRPSSVSPSSRERQKESRYHPGESSAESVGPLHKPSKTQKEMVSLLKAISQETLPFPSHSPTACPRVPARSSSSPPLSSDRKPPQTSRAGQAVDTARPPQCPAAHSRPYKSDYKKECDLDRHCGVLDPVKKKPCTRQLVCNIHSIHQRRKVVGRSKAFDQLVMEHRACSVGWDPDVDRASGEAYTQKDTQPYSVAADETAAAQQIKHSLSRDRPLSRSRGKLDSVLEGDGDGALDVEAQRPPPFNQNPPSSEESEGEEQEEAGDIPASAWHPRPHGICTFGSHTVGCSIFTFGRRLHRLRFALSAMVEHHISAHLWKKIPQVSTSLRSYNKPCVRAAAGGPTGFSSLPPSGQPEPRVNWHEPPKDRQPCGGLVQGSPRNSVGRPSKAHLRKLELTGRSQEDARLPCGGGGGKMPSAKCSRDLPLHEKGQPHSPAKVCPTPSSKGPIANSAVLLGKKPCLPRLLKTPSGRAAPYRAPAPPHRRQGRSPGAQQGPLGYDHRAAAAQKRKAGGSPPLSPSLSRAPKSHRLAPQQPRSSLFSWKAENMGGVLTCGPEKHMDS